MPDRGQASGGSFTYWDIACTGTGSVSGAGPQTADGETLIGGLGDLPDGVIAAQNWFATESNAGTGPCLGWCRGCGVAFASVPDPTITFRFTPGALEINVFDPVTLQLDDSHAPAAWHRDIQSVFLSEVAFDGRVIIRGDFGVPEPGSAALFGLGLAAPAARGRLGHRPVSPAYKPVVKDF